MSPHPVTSRKVVAFLVASILFCWQLATEGQASDVPFVPTPLHIVDQMLSLAGVGEGDLVYDLGSGDGRFVITAALMGARGVGIDIDPERISESNENAEGAGVTDRVAFYQQDLFEAEIGDATVVTIYLLPSINLKLRPKLLSELQPGTRVVSYSFDMEEWQPDQEIRENGREIYLWHIPANMSGVWRWPGPDGNEFEMVVDQQFQQISGSISNGQEIMPIQQAMLAGDQVEITVDHEVGGRIETVVYQGRIDGETLTGTEILGDGASYSWEAVRDPGTEKPLDGPEADVAGKVSEHMIPAAAGGSR
jgi:SAM-dependent methyltransferase